MQDALGMLQSLDAQYRQLLAEYQALVDAYRKQSGS